LGAPVSGTDTLCTTMTTTPQLSAAPQLPYSRFAIWGFVLAFVFPLAGVVLSHIALVSTSQAKTRGKALAIWGVVLNYVFIILAPVIAAMVIWIGALFIMTIFGAPTEVLPSFFEFWAPTLENYFTGY